MVSRVVRWCVAGLVTAAAFSVAAWVSGALVLPPLMRSADDRWAVAVGLGAAVAALVVAWGQSWASRESQPAGAGAGADARAPGTGARPAGQQAPAQQAGDRSIQISGPQHGGTNVTGDDNTISYGGPGPA